MSVQKAIVKWCLFSAAVSVLPIALSVVIRRALAGEFRLVTFTGEICILACSLAAQAAGDLLAVSDDGADDAARLVYGFVAIGVVLLGTGAFAVHKTLGDLPASLSNSLGTFDQDFLLALSIVLALFSLVAGMYAAYSTASELAARAANSSITGKLP